MPKKKKKRGRNHGIMGAEVFFFCEPLCREWVVGVHPLPVHMLLLGFIGHARRSWLRALQTSKVSSAPSCFTCPVAVDATTREVLPSALQVRSSGKQGLSQVTSQMPVLPSLATLPDKLLPTSCALTEPAEPAGTPPVSQSHVDAAPLPTVVHSKGNTQI